MLQLVTASGKRPVQDLFFGLHKERRRARCEDYIDLAGRELIGRFGSETVEGTVV